MKKNYKFIILIVSALVLVTVVAFGISGFKDKMEKVNETDAQRFKREYEEFNGKEVNGMKYTTLEISEKNIIKYVDVHEVEDIFESGDGIVYFGYPSCPWCRTAVPVLLQAAEDAGVDKIYYFDVTGIRSEYKVKDGKLVVEKEGTDEYRHLLKILDGFLEAYLVKDDKGVEYFTGENRLYVPYVFFLKDGEVVATHLDTVESQENPFKALDEEQYEELYSIYTDYIHDMLGDLCDERC
jgi:thiol-disulfide isomerase/thioredoxin